MSDHHTTSRVERGPRASPGIIRRRRLPVLALRSSPWANGSCGCAAKNGVYRPARVVSPAPHHPLPSSASFFSFSGPPPPAGAGLHVHQQGRFGHLDHQGLGLCNQKARGRVSVQPARSQTAGDGALSRTQAVCSRCIGGSLLEGRGDDPRGRTSAAHRHPPPPLCKR